MYNIVKEIGTYSKLTLIMKAGEIHVTQGNNDKALNKAVSFNIGVIQLIGYRSLLIIGSAI